MKKISVLLAMLMILSLVSACSSKSSKQSMLDETEKLFTSIQNNEDVVKNYYPTEDKNGVLSILSTEAMQKYLSEKNAGVTYEVTESNESLLSVTVDATYTNSKELAYYIYTNKINASFDEKYAGLSDEELLNAVVADSIEQCTSNGVETKSVTLFFSKDGKNYSISSATAAMSDIVTARFVTSYQEIVDMFSKTEEKDYSEILNQISYTTINTDSSSVITFTNGSNETVQLSGVEKITPAEGSDSEVKTFTISCLPANSERTIVIDHSAGKDVTVEIELSASETYSYDLTSKVQFEQGTETDQDGSLVFTLTNTTDDIISESSIVVVYYAGEEAIGANSCAIENQIEPGSSITVSVNAPVLVDGNVAYDSFKVFVSACGYKTK